MESGGFISVVEGQVHQVPYVALHCCPCCGFTKASELPPCVKDSRQCLSQSLKMADHLVGDARSQKFVVLTEDGFFSLYGDWQQVLLRCCEAKPVHWCWPSCHRVSGRPILRLRAAGFLLTFQDDGDLGVFFSANTFHVRSMLKIRRYLLFLTNQETASSRPVRDKAHFLATAGSF